MKKPDAETSGKPQIAPPTSAEGEFFQALVG